MRPSAPLHIIIILGTSQAAMVSPGLVGGSVLRRFRISTHHQPSCHRCQKERFTLMLGLGTVSSSQSLLGFRVHRAADPRGLFVASFLKYEVCPLELESFQKALSLSISLTVSGPAKQEAVAGSGSGQVPPDGPRMSRIPR